MLCRLDEKVWAILTQSKMKILIALGFILWVVLKVKKKKKKEKVDLSAILHEEAKVGQDKIQNPTL